MNYKTTLDQLYKDDCKSLECPPGSKLEFISETIFDFTTYDSEMSEILASRMIEVLQSIYDRTTFDYIRSNIDQINYLNMCNMPFLKDKLDWGSSIRGAWFDYDAHEIATIKIEAGQLSEFIRQVIEWSKDD